MKILVVGATGVLGRNVVPRLFERGHSVRAIVRHRDQMSFLEYVGIEPVLGDIFDKDSLHKAARGCDAALNLATSIPKAGDQDWSQNDRIRREGTRNLVEAAVANGLKQYVQQSITLCYGDQGQSIVDESASLNPSAISQSAIDMEEMVRSTSLDWCILRGGMFYGPGTGSEDRWRQAAQQGSLVNPGDGNGLISLVHVVDMARAVVVATESASQRTIYNVVDDVPVSYKRLFGYMTAQLNMEAPPDGGPAFLPSLGCSNTRIKNELAWTPAFPSYMSGLA